MKMLASLAILCLCMGCSKRGLIDEYSGAYRDSQKQGLILTMSSDMGFLLVDGSSQLSGGWAPNDAEDKMIFAFTKKDGEEIKPEMMEATIEPNSDLTFPNGWRFYRVSD